MKRIVAAALLVGGASAGTALVSASPAGALPPSPIQPWGQTVSLSARSTPTDPCRNGINALPTDPCRGLDIAALARLSRDR